MKKSVVLSLASFFTLFTVQSSKADLIDAWDFFNLSASSTPAAIGATVGSATLDISAFTGSQRTSFSGSQLNTFAGSVDTSGNGTALALVGSAANGNSMIFSFDMSGYEDLVVSFATRGTSTGFNSGIWSWSTDNINFTPLSGVNTATTSTTFATATVDFSTQSGLDNASTAYLKYTLSGASSASGNNRIDNIQFNATALPVPEPSSIALAAIGGLLGLVALRRKR